MSLSSSSTSNVSISINDLLQSNNDNDAAGIAFCRSAVSILRASVGDSLSTIADLVLDADIDTAQYQIERTLSRDDASDLSTEHSLLHFAAYARDVSLMTMLLEQRGALKLVNERDIVTGQTPLHIALFAHSRELMHLLVRHGADPSIRDNFGASVFDWAALLFPAPDSNAAAQSAQQRVAVRNRSSNVIELLTLNEFEQLFHISFLQHSRADLSYVLEISFSGFALGAPDVAFREQYSAAMQQQVATNPLDLIVAHVNDAVGWGLFAGRAFRANEFVCRYGGIARSDDAIVDRSYAVASGVDACAIDASHHRSLGGFINHCSTPNVSLQCIFERGVEQVLVIACRDIVRGEQLLHDYTARYFGDEASATAPPLDLSGSRIDL
jgi:hypothetical protein